MLGAVVRIGQLGARFGLAPRIVLTVRERKRFVWPNLRPRLAEPEAELQAWLGSRRVIEHGARLYWLLATPHGGFRQHHGLSEADACRFRALPQWFREGFEGAPSTYGGVA